MRFSFSDFINNTKNGLPASIFSAFCVLLGFVGFALNVFGLPLAVLLIVVGFAVFFYFFNSERKNFEAEQKKKQELAKEEERKEQLRKVSERIERKRAEFSGILKKIPRVRIEVFGSPVKHRSIRGLDLRYWNITHSTRRDSIAPFCAVDIETTGLNHSSDRIIEIAAIKFDDQFRPVSLFHTYVNPEMPIPDQAYQIHRISDEMVEDAPKIYEVLPALASFVSGCHLVAHNADFDFSFLYAAGFDLPDDCRLYDTLQLARTTIPKSEIENYKLGTLAQHYDIYPTDAHRSTEDALTVGTIFTAIVASRTDLAIENVHFVGGDMR